MLVNIDFSVGLAEKVLYYNISNIYVCFFAHFV